MAPAGSDFDQVFGAPAAARGLPPRPMKNQQIDSPHARRIQPVAPALLAGPPRCRAAALIFVSEYPITTIWRLARRLKDDDDRQLGMQGAQNISAVSQKSIDSSSGATSSG